MILIGKFEGGYKAERLTGGLYHSTNWAIVCAVVVLAHVIMNVHPENFYEQAGLGIVSGGLLYFLPIYLYTKRKEKTNWGNITRPIIVADWGARGSRDTIEQIPRHLRSMFILCHPVEARTVERECHQLLRESRNFQYHGLPEEHRLPVIVAMCRDSSQTCNESDEEYTTRLIEMAEDANRAWYEKAEKYIEEAQATEDLTAEEVRAIRREQYEKVFLYSGANGSVRE